MEQKTLLLHCCCGPCASACVERLLQEGRRVVLFYSNSNIVSRGEFEKRLMCVRRLAAEFSLELVVDEYDHAAWLKSMGSLPDFESFPEGGARCRLCFGFSLARAAEYAGKNNMSFATSLTVSPHKNSKVIFEVGAQYSHFEPYDFKKKDGFKRSLELARKFGFYRQNFCGCEFSYAESLARLARMASAPQG